MTQMGDFALYVRDPLYGQSEQITNWISFTFILRFNRTGSWELEIPRESYDANYFTNRSGIIVKYQGTNIFSGQVTTDFVKTKTTVKMSGKDDMWFLEGPARPNPNQIVGPYPSEYDVSTGIASTIMRSLVDRNIGPSAVGGWKVPAIVLQADPLVGGTITARARFDPLITLLAELASTPAAGGLGFRMVQHDTLANKIQFSMYYPRDLHQDTIFSTELGTAQDYEYTYTFPGANYFIVGGGDDLGAKRTTVEDGDTTAISNMGRIVAQFVDKRGVTDTSELNQALAEQIATAISGERITFIPVDDNALQFSTHYYVGDYVTGVVDGVQYPRIIREIEVNLDPNQGVLIKPTLADPYSFDEDEITAQHFAAIENRVLNLEQNWNVPDDSITENMLHPFMKWKVGDIKMSALPTSQSGWLFCNGSAVSRSVYSRLFAAISTTFGVGDGSTTFNLPDLRNRFPIGAGTLNTLGTQIDVTQMDIDHVHTHSHGLQNHLHNGIAHTHPGSHSHGHAHNHNVASGTGIGSGTNFGTVTTGTSPSSTDADTGAPAASYGTNTSVPVPNSSDPDASHPDGYTLGHKYITYTNPSRTAVNFQIYAGA